MSGLGAALASGLPVYEAAPRPGGVCHSYYRAPDGSPRDPLTDDVSNCFRFEPAGGHWLFGVSDAALDRLAGFCRLRKYARQAAVFFPQEGRCVPYPLQDNLRYLDPRLRDCVLAELRSCRPPAGTGTPSFKDWLLASFGPTLCELFFFPFNDRYTAGLFHRVAPQDLYKSPIDLERVLQGAFRPAPDPGYNCVFYYPEGGLDKLVRALSAGSRVHLGRRVSRIDTARRVVWFSEGESITYDRVVSTIPLDRMVRLCGVRCASVADLATAVLVVNVAARRGDRCPPYHWVYVPSSKSGVHRVGFYSNVDASFLPARDRGWDGVVSVYAERSYLSGSEPTSEDLARAADAIVDELREWGFIEEVLVLDPTFTDPAYTWSWPGSGWAEEAIGRLAARGIHQIGRYGAWRFQGMMASFEEGFAAGRAVARGEKEPSCRTS
jgi:protoporphyrinogen oxidase